MVKVPKLRTVVTLLLVGALLALALPTVASADGEAYPCIFKGAVEVNGVAASAGTPVKAYIGVTEMAGTTTGSLSGQADNEYLVALEGQAGAEVTFQVFVDGAWRDAAESGTLLMWGKVTVDLTVSTAPGDTTPPAAVTDLAVAGSTQSSVTLTWTAPGDDGNSGTAASYDIRYALSQITDATWDAATQAVGEPGPQVAGSSETFTITGLSPATSYWFALKTADEVPNISGISNSPGGLTASPGPAEFSALLGGGWNLMSTPVTLDPAHRNLGSIIDPADLVIAYRWYAPTQVWQQVTSTLPISPLEAFYVKVSRATTAHFVPSTDPSAPPLRQLYTRMNLIGAAPPVENGAFIAMAVDEALVSIEQTAGGLLGYTQVVSPPLNQEGWVYTHSGEDTPHLLPFKGYWVHMENVDSLAGFSTTPVALD